MCTAALAFFDRASCNLALRLALCTAALAFFDRASCHLALRLAFVVEPLFDLVDGDILRTKQIKRQQSYKAPAIDPPCVVAAAHRGAFSLMGHI